MDVVGAVAAARAVVVVVVGGAARSAALHAAASVPTHVDATTAHLRSTAIPA